MINTKLVILPCSMSRNSDSIPYFKIERPFFPTRNISITKPTGPVNHMGSNNSPLYKRLDKRRRYNTPR